MLAKPRNRKLFDTTSTDDTDIAAPAINGFSRPAAATGIAARLYPNAQARFPRIVPSVRWASRSASGTTRRSSRTRIRSAARSAMSVPVAIPRPRSAVARAGASFTPSPTIATR